MDGTAMSNMAGIAVRANAEATPPRRTWFMVLIVGIAAAGIYALMRIDGGQAIQSSYAHLCARLVMQPRDWPCRVSDANTTVLYIAGSLSVGLGLAIP
jgi:hypothetical protein